MPATADPEEQFLRAAVDITNGVKKWTGVGFRVDALRTIRPLQTS